MFVGLNTTLATGDTNAAHSAVFMGGDAANSRLVGYRSSGAMGYASITPDQNFQASSIYNGSNNTMRINGVTGASVASSAAFNFNQIRLGVGFDEATPIRRWIGSIREVIFYATNPSDGDATLQKVKVIEQDQRKYHGTP